MITVTKRFRFCYGHHLPEYDGVCARYHGHNSEVEIEFVQPTDWETYEGMVLDFTDIKKHVGPIIEELDHRNLNDLFARPTAENIAMHIASQITGTKIGTGLVRVRVTETPDSWAEWRKTL